MQKARTVEGELRKALHLAARIRERLDYVLRAESREQAKLPAEERVYRPLPEGFDESVKAYSGLMGVVIKGHQAFARRAGEEMTPEEVALAEDEIRKQVLREASSDELAKAMERYS